jgi:dethiobiotin synthetase
MGASPRGRAILMGSALFITGTGTDVGKTALSLAILLWARQRGLRAAYHKPVQCGSDDAEWIRAAAPCAIDAQVTYRLRMPASPHLAAETENTALDMGRIGREAAALMAANDLVVLEGAGGPAVPFDRRGATLASLAAEMSLPCLVACAPGLGTLHHTLATLAFLAAARVQAAGFAFCHREAEPPALCADNIATLKALTGLPFFGELGYREKLARGASLTGAEADAWIEPLVPALEVWWKTARK